MTAARTLWSIGLMSGTSLDGVDAALLRTDGRHILAVGPAATSPYPAHFRARLRTAIAAGAADDLLIRDLTERHAAAALALLTVAGLEKHAVGVIGFHGQTIRHAPEARMTVQIGDGALLARLTGIDVVNDFRSQDVAAGGQGAPLVPIFHQALAADLPLPLAVLNVGGVANVTYIDASGALSAFDTGPGNALLDDWALRHRGEPIDRGGLLASAGRVDAAVLAHLMSHPFFEAPAPKSLDRDAFAAHAGCHALEGLAPADGAATLVAFTAAAVAKAVALLPEPPVRWLICGGGRHNPAIMRALRQALKTPVAPVEDVGWDGDALEAQAFAFLAVRALLQLPLSFPGTTGVPMPLTGGRLHPAPRNA